MIVANRYRVRADEARLRAGLAISPVDKAAWLLLAEDWQKFADATVDVQVPQP
jgi:hypothetical protein